MQEPHFVHFCNLIKKHHLSYSRYDSFTQQTLNKDLLENENKLLNDK